MVKKITRIKHLSLTIILSLFFGIFTSAVSANTSYELGLTKGTEEYTVDLYYADAWKTSVDTSSNPTQFFEGNANVTGAKSKQTIKGWMSTTYTTYDALLSLYFSIFEYGAWNMYLTNLTTAGYNETAINTNYPNTYEAWYGISAEWWFTEGEYKETPNNTLSPIIIMKNPADYKLIIDACNDIIEEILNDPLVDLSIKFYFSNKTADDFLWQLIFYGFGAGSPQVGYLETLITELACKNVSAQESTLIFEKTGITNYTVEVSYGSKGILSEFTVKDVSDDIIYHITSSNTDWIFFTILIVMLSVTGAVIILIVYRNRKLKI